MFLFSIPISATSPKPLSEMEQLATSQLQRHFPAIQFKEELEITVVCMVIWLTSHCLST